MARHAGAHVTKVNGGHLALVSDPCAVAAVIERAAASS